MRRRQLERAALAAPSLGLRDPLSGRAAALVGDSEIVSLLIEAERCGVGRDLVERTRRRARRLTGIELTTAAVTRALTETVRRGREGLFVPVPSGPPVVIRRIDDEGR